MSDEVHRRRVLPWWDLTAATPVDPTHALPATWKSDSVEIVDDDTCHWKARKWTGPRYVEIVADAYEELVAIARAIDAGTHPN